MKWLASRLEGACTPDRIRVSAATRQLIGEMFPAEARGPVEVKGFSEPVEVYEIDPAAFDDRELL